MTPFRFWAVASIVAATLTGAPLRAQPCACDAPCPVVKTGCAACVSGKCSTSSGSATKAKSSTTSAAGEGSSACCPLCSGTQSGCDSCCSACEKRCGTSVAAHDSKRHPCSGSSCCQDCPFCQALAVLQAHCPLRVSLELHSATGLKFAQLTAASISHTGVATGKPDGACTACQPTIQIYSVKDLVGGGDATLENNLIRVLTTSVAPASWSVHGGSGSISYCVAARALVVTQRPGVQAQVRAILTGLRRAREDADRVNVHFSAGAVGFLSCPGLPGICVPADRFASIGVMPVPMSSVPGCVAPLPGALGPVAAAFAPAMSGTPGCPAGCPAMRDSRPFSLVTALAPPLAPVADLCTMTASEASGEPRIALHCGSGCRALCRDLVLDHTGGGCVKIANAGKQISASGTGFEARADRVCLAPRGDRLLLDGHVRLKYHRGGERAAISAEHVLLNFKDGKLEMLPAPRPIAAGQHTASDSLAQLKGLAGCIP